MDTWGWLALGHRKDPFHNEVKSYYQSLRSEGHHIVTSDYVLDETITLVFKREHYKEGLKFMEGIFQAAETGNIIVEKVTADRFGAAWRLRKRFHDKPLISFTDLVSMAIMRERKIPRIITHDDHFTHVGMGFQIVP